MNRIRLYCKPMRLVGRSRLRFRLLRAAAHTVVVRPTNEQHLALVGLLMISWDGTDLPGPLYVCPFTSTDPATYSIGEQIESGSLATDPFTNAVLPAGTIKYACQTPNAQCFYVQDVSRPGPAVLTHIVQWVDLYGFTASQLGQHMSPDTVRCDIQRIGEHAKGRLPGAEVGARQATGQS